jgi:hypothetical protein
MEDKITELISGKVNQEFIDSMNAYDMTRIGNRSILKKLAKLEGGRNPSKNSEFNRAETIKTRLKNKLIDKRNKHNANE